jgi:hypothetical protein
MSQRQSGNSGMRSRTLFYHHAQRCASSATIDLSTGTAWLVCCTSLWHSFVTQELVSDLMSTDVHSLEFWVQLMLCFVALYLRIFVHYIGTATP